MLNNYMTKQSAHRAFYFNPEGNMGNGATPDDNLMEAEVQRVPAPEEESATETQTETTQTSTTH